MTDYKAAFQQLTEKLGRVPTTSDSEYWQLPGSPSAREGKTWNTGNGAMTAESTEDVKDQTKAIPTTGATIAEPSSSVTNAALTGQTTTNAPIAPQASKKPVSRKQAPQAGVYAREEGHEHDYGPTAVPGAWYCQCGALLLASTEQERALANPRSAVPPPEAVTVPETNSEPVRASQNLSGYRVGARGPNGGMVAKCEGCGELWEREKKRGRPAYKCPTCR